jgi:hypothetical protein
MVFLFTDDDSSYPEARIDNRTVCIDHFYQNRRPAIKHHLPIMSFIGPEGSGARGGPYLMPVWEHTTYEQKMLALQKSEKAHPGRVVVAFLGLGHPRHPQVVVDAIKNYQQVGTVCVLCVSCVCQVCVLCVSDVI